MSFLNHEKSLIEVDSGYNARFMNVNTKSSQMQHCAGTKYGMIYRSDMYNSKIRKNSEKNI